MTTVRELIDALSKLPQDEDIFIRDRGFEHSIIVHRWIGKKIYCTVGVVKL